ncbi:MAG: PilZ domain-containing protein [Deltaproteobacteria bacterium]|nr:PilZ domain-containing protein [Deltaproteobacteria bacterium]
MTSEKRKHLRAPVEMWVKEESEEHYFVHRASNISIGGLFLENKVVVKKNTISTYLFRLPTSQQLIVVQGKPVYDSISEKKKNRKGTGIKFLDLSPEAKQLIRDYVHAHQNHAE